MIIEATDFYLRVTSFIGSTLNRIALAVSGGADSMCMALMMKTTGMSFVCLVVDHGLRRESAQEALAVKEYLATHNINATILQWHQYQEDMTVKNLHHTARQARYGLLLAYCKKHDIKCLGVAHNKDDQAENVLLRIARGTGIDGIAEMRDTKNADGVIIMRPLLQYTRKTIERTLINYGWQWFNDPSNHNPKFARTRIRKLLQQDSTDHGLTIERICLLASNASRASSYLKEQTKKYWAKVCMIDQFGSVAMNIQLFLSLHQEIKLRLLATALKFISKSEYPLRLNSLEVLLQRIEIKEKWRDTTLSGCEIMKISPDFLLFIREKKCIKPLFLEKPQKSALWDQRIHINIKNEISQSICIKALDQKDWFYIKKQPDFCFTMTVNHKVRMTLPVLVLDGDLISCPMLNWSKSGYEIKTKLETQIPEDNI